MAKGYYLSIRYDTAQGGVAGEWMADMAPSSYRRDGTVRGVVYCHGAGQDAFVPMSRLASGPVGTLFGQQPLICELARNFPVACCDLGGSQTWSSDAAINAVTAAVAWLKDPAKGGAKTDKVYLVGVSMGNLAAMGWARTHVADVAAICSLIPVSDLNDIVANNRGGFAGNVNAALGHVYNEGADGPTRNPTNYGAALAGIPTRLYYAGSDTVVIPSTVTGLATVIGSSATAVSAGALPHGESAIAAIDPTLVTAFLRAAP